ncbi:MAG TPA: HD domain-containing phosphohydrolase, partial [Pyrinomonadaceae bacterium]
HEWWDGTGYPDALRREQIPLPARILRAADAYAALTDDRPFRRALTEEAARKHLTEWAAIEFDPRVVHTLLSLRDVPELRSYARRGGDEDTAQDRARESAEVDRAEADRAEADHSEVDLARAVRAEDSRAEAGGSAASGLDEWGAPKR